MFSAAIKIGRLLQIVVGNSSPILLEVEPSPSFDDVASSVPRPIPCPCAALSSILPESFVSGESGCRNLLDFSFEPFSF